MAEIGAKYRVAPSGGFACHDIVIHLASDKSTKNLVVLISRFPLLPENGSVSDRVERFDWFSLLWVHFRPLHLKEVSVPTTRRSVDYSGKFTSILYSCQCSVFITVYPLMRNCDSAYEHTVTDTETVEQSQSPLLFTTRIYVCSDDPVLCLNIQFPHHFLLALFISCMKIQTFK